MKDLAHKIYQQKIEKQLPFTLTKNCVNNFLTESLFLIMPGMTQKNFKDSNELELVLIKHSGELKKILSILEKNEMIEGLINKYQKEILVLTNKIENDARAMLEGDPAAKSLSEVLICYPGLLAIAIYRLAHFFQTENVELFPRILSELAHEKTGIDIHPAAIIGESFFIDHGTGIVIGETAIIGNSVKIYQGVTLGALSVDKNLATLKRHPTIEDNCVIYSHATILGGDTIIGSNSVIGGNVWMTKSVAPHSVVYHKSEVKLDKNKKSDFLNNLEELTYEI